MGRQDQNNRSWPWQFQSEQIITRATSVDVRVPVHVYCLQWPTVQPVHSVIDRLSRLYSIAIHAMPEFAYKRVQRHTTGKMRTA